MWPFFSELKPVWRMDLGLDFDDSDFAKEEKPKQLLTSYNAKICSPQWFLENSAENGHTDKATLYKFRGDYHFRLTDYEKAIVCYNISLDNLGSQNRTMRREITESLARCYTNTGNTDRARQLADKVMEDCLTRDQTCHGLILKQQIYKKAGLLREEAAILYQLIHLHPRNVQFWMSLKNVYERLPSDLVDKHTDQSRIFTNSHDLINTQDTIKKKTFQFSCDIPENQTHCEMQHRSSVHTVGQEIVDQRLKNLSISAEDLVKVEQENSFTDSNIDISEGILSRDDGHLNERLNQRDILTGLPCRLIHLTCCIRIRLILQSVQGTVGSFIKDNNLKLQRKIDEEVASLGVDDLVLKKATEFMKKDVFDDDSTEVRSDGEGQEKDDIPTFTPEEFNRRWFSWINDT